MKERIILAPVSTEPGSVQAIVERARRRGFRAFVSASRPPRRPPRTEEWFVRDRFGLYPFPTSERAPPVPVRSVRNPRQLEQAIEVAQDRGTVAIRWRGGRMIPLETAVARAQRRFSIWVVTDRVADVPGVLGALERGADRVVVELSSPDQVDSLEREIDGGAVGALPWFRASVTRVTGAGVSDRVIVDTTSILRSDEGLLVGSSAATLFHVLGEVKGSLYTRPRPFRVNAGSVHSYVLMSDGATRYLSELEPGDRILIARAGGGARSVRVGRLKIERRPMLLIETGRGVRKATIFLQEAETVRLSVRRGSVPTTELRPGQQVLAVALPAGRHLGQAVDETVEER